MEAPPAEGAPPPLGMSPPKLELPKRCGVIEALACEGSAGAGSGSAPGVPPVPDDGLEKSLVAAVVIMRSGGARSGAGGAGSGRRAGAEPNGDTREYQLGPDEPFAAGRPATWMTIITSATIAAKAPAA